MLLSYTGSFLVLVSYDFYSSSHADFHEIFGSFHACHRKSLTEPVKPVRNNSYEIHKIPIVFNGIPIIHCEGFLF